MQMRTEKQQIRRVQFRVRCVQLKSQQWSWNGDRLQWSRSSAKHRCVWSWDASRRQWGRSSPESRSARHSCQSRHQAHRQPDAGVSQWRVDPHPSVDDVTQEPWSAVLHDTCRLVDYSSTDIDVVSPSVSVTFWTEMDLTKWSRQLKIKEGALFMTVDAACSNLLHLFWRWEIACWSVPSWSRVVLSVMEMTWQWKKQRTSLCYTARSSLTEFFGTCFS